MATPDEVYVESMPEPGEHPDEPMPEEAPQPGEPLVEDDETHEDEDDEEGAEAPAVSRRIHRRKS